LVVDYHNHAMRLVSKARAVSTLAGDPRGRENTEGLSSAGQEGAVGQHKEAVRPAQARGSEGGRGGVEAGGRARLAADGHGLGASFADGLRRRAGRGRALQRAAQRSVVVTANGEIVMTDLGNHAVRVVTAARCAHWPALAGNGKRGFVDGQGAAARFNYPIGLAVDVDGSIQVTDCGNHVVGRVTMAGAVSTVAGNGQKRYGDEAARLIAPAPW
jgi:hypothetical protein